MKNLSEVLYAKKEDLRRWPTVILALAMVTLYSLGVYSTINIFILHAETFNLLSPIIGVFGDIVSGNILSVTYLLIALISLTIFLIPSILFAMAKYGKKVVTITIFTPTLIVIGLGFLAIVAGIASSSISGAILSLVGFIFVLFGGGFLFSLLRWRENIDNVGYVFELSAKAVATEMGTLVPSILYGLFALFNSIMGTASGFFVNEMLAPINNSVLTGFSIFLVELGYAWLLFSSMYIADGTIISMIDDWYRNPTMNEANLRKGFFRVRQVLVSVVQFGFVMAFLDTLARTAKKGEGGEGIGGVFLSLLARVLAKLIGLVQFITYFTLPAMILEGKGFKDSIMKSYTLIWRHSIDVLLTYLFFDTVCTFFISGMLILYGVGGATIGWLIIAPTLISKIEPIFVSLLSALIFVLFGFIPAYFLFRPIKVAYNTILYEFAQDMETSFQLPSRMPLTVRQQFQTIIEREQTRAKGNRWAEPKLPAEEIVEKIKYEFQEARTEGLTKYVKSELKNIKSELSGEIREGVKEVGLLNEFYEHLYRIGLDVELLSSGSPETIKEPCIKINGQNINFVQIQGFKDIRGQSEAGKQYHYVVQGSVKGLEGKLKAEIKPPTYWKLDLNNKRVIDFQWEGGELAKRLNADSELKNMLLQGGLDKLVIGFDRGRQSIRIIHMPGTWTTIKIGSDSMTVGRKQLPTPEDFAAYNRIAQHIRSILGSQPMRS